MRLGVVSDSHDALALARSAASLFAQEGCDLVVHCGDVTGGPAARCFDGLPVRFLRGNNDVDPALSRAVLRLGVEDVTDVWEDDVAGLRVGATHGHIRAHVARLPTECDLVLMGHSHRRSMARVGRALVVNPGALYRCPTKTCAIVDLPRLDVRFFEVREDACRPLRNGS